MNYFFNSTSPAAIRTGLGVPLIHRPMVASSRCDEWFCTTNNFVPPFMNSQLVNIVIVRLGNWILVPIAAKTARVYAYIESMHPNYKKTRQGLRLHRMMMSR